ncbi:hypothetical protein B0H67DRAFT_584616 [Lasiosphaeris hirsuta]|uniref:Uncharacterized protein n=1 Tax=Lasiosphaeris hirsuta TaxID=260670 RepID=A0AA40A8L5_9PEZI|nr:hypothetical protein B0H67DRAFT_584616 [Lasiosphaeris hirsuta]
MGTDPNCELVPENREDDVDSLFGGADDDAASLFTEDGESCPPAIEPPRELDREAALLIPNTSPPQAANSSVQLSFPAITFPQQPLPPQQSPRVSHSTSSSPPLPSQKALPAAEGPVAGAFQLTFPTVPDPPGASLSYQDGHTSGDPVVSTHNFAHNLPTPELVPFDEPDLDAHLEELWRTIETQARPINAHPEPHQCDSHQASQTENGEDSVADHGGPGIALTKVPGFRYADAATNRDIRLPYRIDSSPREAEVLAPYITLRRSIKFKELYDGLELGVDTGKMLTKDIKKYLKTSPFKSLVDEKSGYHILATKVAFLNAAFHMLSSEEWGSKWLGPGCHNAQERTMFWPTSSTMLIIHFVMLLYRVIICEKQSLSKLNRGSKAKEDSAELPEDTPTPTTTRLRSPTMMLFDSFGTTGRAVTRLPTQESRLLLDSLVKNVTNNKKRRRSDTSEFSYEVEVPDDAKLTYHIYIKDKTNWADLSPSAVYRHTDSIITRGAFTYLKTSLEAAGESPAFEILTPYGPRVICSEDDWDQAIIAIYNRRRSGGQVEVDIFV